MNFLEETEETPVLRLLQSLSPTALLSIPFLILGGITIFLIYTLPMAGMLRWLFFAGLFVSVLFSRMIQFWENGVEIYNFITFCFALTFGPLAALLFTASITVPVLILSVFHGGHMFNHSIPGPITQTINLIMLSIVGGLLKLIAYDFVVSHLLIFAMVAITICDYLITGILRHKLTPLTIDRIAVYAVLSFIINYNLFTTFGPRFIEILATIQGL